MQISVKGVEKSYVFQTGRQIRVIVDPKVINDFDAHTLARNLKQKLEQMITIPYTIWYSYYCYSWNKSDRID